MTRDTDKKVENAPGAGLANDNSSMPGAGRLRSERPAGGADKVKAQKKTDGTLPDASARHYAHAGAMLSAAREALGLSVTQISDLTNIRPNRVEAIEELNICALPAPTFTLGFVRAYARVVDVPEDPIVERFRRDAAYPAANTLPSIAYNHRQNGARPPRATTQRFNVLGAVGILLVAMWLPWQILKNNEANRAAEAAAGTSIPLLERSRGDGSGDAVAETETIAAGEAFRRPAEDAGTGETSSVAETPVEIAANVPTLAPEPALPAEAPPAPDEGGVAETPEPAEPETPTAAPAARLPGLRTAAASTSAGTSTVAASADDSEPQARYASRPSWPSSCGSSASQGEVTVIHGVSRFGKVMAPRIGRSSNRCFNQAAIEEVSRWDFSPARRDGQAVRVEAHETQVVFNR